MKKIMAWLLLFIGFSLAVNAQRGYTRRPVTQNRPVLRHKIWLRRHPLRIRDQRERKIINKELILSDTLQIK
jgi:hypothetical protein